MTDTGRSPAAAATTARWAVLGVVGAALGALFVGLTGILAIRVIGAESGAVLDLNNVVVGVRPPHAGHLPLLAGAVLAVVILLALVRGTDRMARRDRLVIAISFALVVLGLVVWGTRSGWLYGPGGQLAVGVPEGWRGWLREGARSSGVHVVLLIVLGWVWHLWRSPRAVPAAGEPELQSPAER